MGTKGGFEIAMYTLVDRVEDRLPILLQTLSPTRGFGSPMSRSTAAMLRSPRQQLALVFRFQTGWGISEA